MNKKESHTCDHQLGSLEPTQLMEWGTPECIKTIHVVVQHFYEMHDSNQATLGSTSVTQFGTPTNTPCSHGQIFLLFDKFNKKPIHVWF